MPGDPLSRPLIEIARELRDRRASARELVEAAIARHERFGERLHAYSFWAPEQARTVADAADAAFAAGVSAGPLQGLPVSIKDLFAAGADVSEFPEAGGDIAIGGAALAEDRATGAIKPLSSVKFSPDNDVKCLQSATESGDPTTGRSTLILKAFPGCVVPWHFHTAEEQLIVEFYSR